MTDELRGAESTGRRFGGSKTNADAAQQSFQARFDAFGIFWLTAVTVFGLVQLVWGIYELRRGSARWGWMGTQYSRDDEPFYYWLAVLSRFGGFVVACFMFWFGFGLFNAQ